MKPIDPRDVDFGGPATYRIVVRGVLNADWSDRMAGMAISTVEEREGVTYTTLVGGIRDQAELKGILDTLYSLHLPIVDVETIEAGS